MSETPVQTNSNDARESAWARPVDRLKVAGVSPEAMNLNVEGRRLTGPVKGFGQMWQKTYSVRLSGVDASPADVIRAWKENFPKFWPKGNRFFAPLTNMQPGDVAVLNLAGPGGLTGPGGMPVISTGIMVIYSDDESFSFMTPEGHMLAGLITFSACEDEGAPLVQVQVLIRPYDPLYELTFRLGVGHKTEDDFWQHTLTALAAHFGVQGHVVQKTTLVDSRVQWSEAKNIWHNAAIRTALYLAAAPLRWVRGLGKPKPGTGTP
jgi:hypothetical protein